MNTIVNLDLDEESQANQANYLTGKDKYFSFFCKIPYGIPTFFIVSIIGKICKDFHEFYDYQKMYQNLS